jgi:hypothetical protein
MGFGTFYFIKIKHIGNTEGYTIKLMNVNRYINIKIILLMGSKEDVKNNEIMSVL